MPAMVLACQDGYTSCAGTWQDPLLPPTGCCCSLAPAATAAQVGGGPTGVEVAAELMDLVEEDVAHKLPHIEVGRRLLVSMESGLCAVWAAEPGRTACERGRCSKRQRGRWRAGWQARRRRLRAHVSLCAVCTCPCWKLPTPCPPLLYIASAQEDVSITVLDGLDTLLSSFHT